MNTYFDQEDEYKYCHNVPKDSFLYISDFDFNLDMYAYDGTSPSSHNLCEWRIALRKDVTVVLDISRSNKNYEEIYIYANTDDVSLDHFSKEFTN